MSGMMAPEFIHTMAPPLVQKPAFLGVIWVGTAIGTIALSFRYYVRIKFFHRLQLDDVLTGVAWVFLLATAILWTVIINDLYNIKLILSGQKYPDAGFLHSLEQYLHGSLAVLLMFYLGLWTIKLNFLVFFYRLGGQISYYRTYWWIVTFLTVAAGAGCIGSIQYQCTAVPVTTVLAKCSGPDATKFQNITLKVNCGLDVFTDALIMSLPISILWNVRVSLSRKLKLAALFSLVIITMAIAVVRVTVVTSKDAVTGSNQVEVTWLYLWHFIESSVALLVACLASFRTLFAVKERRAEAEEAQYREQALRDSEPKPKVLWARAKHFQDSLFSTHKSTTQTTHVEKDNMDYPLRSTVTHKGSISTENTDERRSMGSVGSMPTLNSHGLLESVNSMEQKHADRVV